MNMPSFLSLMLLLLAVTLVTNSKSSNDVSAFLTTRNYYHHAVVEHKSMEQPKHVHLYPSKQLTNTQRTALNMNYKSPDEGNSYNDDAFGLVFLTGGVISQDVEFVATFASLSAIAAISTSAGLLKKDERVPAAVALLALLVSPFVSSLVQSGSLENIAAPMPVEIGLCTISAIWAFVNWSQEKES